MSLPADGGKKRVMLPSAVRRFAGALFSAVRDQMPGVRLHQIEGASAQHLTVQRAGDLASGERSIYRLGP